MQNNNATAFANRAHWDTENGRIKKYSPFGYYLFPLQIRTLCMWTTFFLSHSTSSLWAFYIHFRCFFALLIVAMDFKAERHKTTTFSGTQCQTPKYWRRNQAQKLKGWTSAQKKNEKKSKSERVGKQKFSWKSIYDSRFLSDSFSFQFWRAHSKLSISFCCCAERIRFVYLSWLQLHTYFLP